jgi:hypothetical protein
MKFQPAVICIVLASCSGSSSFEDAAKKAWSTGDSAAVGMAIETLNDPQLTDYQFYDRLVILSQVTGFCYVNADVSDSGFVTSDIALRKIRRRNICRVYSLYRQSCLFMQPTTWEVSTQLQDSVWADSTVLTPTEMSRLKQMILRRCIP